LGFPYNQSFCVIRVIRDKNPLRSISRRNLARGSLQYTGERPEAAYGKPKQLKATTKKGMQMNPMKLQKKSIRLAMVLGLAALLSSLASVNASVYSWDTNNPNTSVNPNTGQTITLQGACTFDTVANTVSGRGSYRITASNGTVVSRGQWVATQFVSFVSYPGCSTPNGLQTGLMKIYVTLYPTMGGSMPNQLMTSICPCENGTFDEDDDGTTVGGFTVITGGITVFHLLRP
jgi:hypothetical protein